MKNLFIFTVLALSGQFTVHCSKLSISLTELDTFAGKLWDVEKNRINILTDYTVNVQGKLQRSDGSDHAPLPLFSGVNKQRLGTVAPTIPLFMKLMDNYKASVGVDERFTPAEEAEIQAFLNQVMQSSAMKETYTFLKAKGLKASGVNDFKEQLYRIWFELYKRKSPRDSSAFEHVFVGENKNGEVSGFHNWLQFIRLEEANQLDYQGYFAKNCGNPPRLITGAFKINNVQKPRGSLLLGISPEFEMALYTTIFMSGHPKVTVHLGTCAVVIQCYPINGGRQIGTCYPR